MIFFISYGLYFPFLNIVMNKIVPFLNKREKTIFSFKNSLSKERKLLNWSCTHNKYGCDLFST